MSIVGAHNVCTRSQHDPDSIERQIRQGSRRWKQYHNRVLDVCRDEFSLLEVGQSDFNAGLTHAIVVSGVNEDKKSKNNTENIMVVIIYL